jgi:intracellular sulfur oxidation DsrE/DsrF family protein
MKKILLLLAMLGFLYAEDGVKKVVFDLRLVTLAKNNNVEFLMCESGMKHNNIDKTTLYSYVKVTPNVTIGLIDKQSEGYVYIPIKD